MRRGSNTPLAREAIRGRNKVGRCESLKVGTAFCASLAHCLMSKKCFSQKILDVSVVKAVREAHGMLE